MTNESAPVDVLGLVGGTVDQVRFDACVDAGGFGLIYRGYHLGLAETVAIKCLRIASMQKTNDAMREALAGRFRDETKLLYRLSQGNLDIVRCMSSGTLIAPTTKEYTPYMILEWLEGTTLSVDLKQRRTQKLKPRSLDAAIGMMDSAAGAIAYAHANDVVHRDVKPGNLFLTKTREGIRMKVLDFGLAKILDDEATGIRPSVETAVGVHFCSPSYGAPEQYSSKVGKIGPWTDVYSFTLVLLEVLTGDKVRPAGTLAEGLIRAMDKKTGSPSATSLGLQLPAAVEDLLLRAVAQNPLERPRDLGAFWSALKEAMAAAPKPNLAAATVMDDGVGDAMQQVRAAAARASQMPASMAPAPGQGQPFTGTMLMHNAPSGAPHLVAGAPPTTTAPMPATGSVGRLAAGAQLAATVLGEPPKPSSQPPGPLKMTMPIGSMSPLSPSMAPRGGSVSPAPQNSLAPVPQNSLAPVPQNSLAPVPQNSLAPVPQASLAPSPGGSVAPPRPQRVQGGAPNSYPPPRNVSTDPGVRAASSDAPLAQTTSGAMIALLIALGIAIAGGAFYWFRMRGD